MSRRRRMPRNAPDLFDIVIGSLFSGYGGIDQAARLVLGGVVAWHADIKPAAVRLLKRRYPGAPNLGSVVLVDFRKVTPVDVLTFGWPCQPFSSAGRGLGADDPRALWPFVARAVAQCRPPVLVGENVDRVCTNGELRRVVGALADLGYVVAWRVAAASDTVGACHRRRRLVLVAVDATADPARVARIVAALDHEPVAATRQPDAGAPLLPTPRESVNSKSRRAMTASTGNGRRSGGGQSSPPGLDEVASLLSGVRPPNLPADAELPPATRALVASLLPTPTARDATRGKGWGDQPGRPLSETVHRLLPTPLTTDGKRGARGAGSVNAGGGQTLPGALFPTPTQSMTTGPGTSGRDGGLNLQTAVHLLPTPTAQAYGNNRGGAAGRTGKVRESLETMVRNGSLVDVDRWGEYGPAVARWEAEHGPAPDPMICRPPKPVRLGKRGRDGVWLRPSDPQLNPVFVEWMQGVAPGWVTSSSILGTEVAGMPPVQLTERGTWAGERAAMLSLLGDGVVVPYIAASIRYLLPLVLDEVAELRAAS